LYEKGQDKNNKGKPGQKIGHKGVTRPYATPDEQGKSQWIVIINPGVEPTNNRAERALRHHVVLRKILGTMRNR
jgi:hypothetical protein